jgi:hypothetical protein
VVTDHTSRLLPRTILALIPTSRCSPRPRSAAALRNRTSWLARPLVAVTSRRPPICLGRTGCCAVVTVRWSVSWEFVLLHGRRPRWRPAPCERRRPRGHGATTHREGTRSGSCSSCHAASGVTPMPGRDVSAGLVVPAPHTEGAESPVRAGSAPAALGLPCYTAGLSTGATRACPLTPVRVAGF